MLHNRIVFAQNVDTDAYFQVIDAYKKWWRKRIKLSSAATLSETALQTKHVSILVNCSKISQYVLCLQTTLQAMSNKSSKDDKL